MLIYYYRNIFVCLSTIGSSFLTIQSTNPTHLHVTSFTTIYLGYPPTHLAAYPVISHTTLHRLPTHHLSSTLPTKAEHLLPYLPVYQTTHIH